MIPIYTLCFFLPQARISLYTDPLACRDGQDVGFYTHLPTRAKNPYLQRESAYGAMHWMFCTDYTRTERAKYAGWLYAVVRFTNGIQLRMKADY